MRNNLQKKVWLVLLGSALCFSSFAADRVSQIIRGSDYESLKKTFDEEIRRSQERLGRARELEKRYPKDPRPAKNRKAWETHISLCEDRFFSVLKEIFTQDIETSIQAPNFAKLREEYRRRIGIIDKRLKILSDLREKYPSHDTSQLESELRSSRQQFKDAHYSCPQHQSYCRNCISQREKCRACGGRGYWGFWGWNCQLCKGSGKVYAPGKTYCPKCHGRWDQGRNCRNCNYSGLIPCPAHNENMTKCPFCETVNGDITGQSLEP